ncbi:sigma-70 family RNA polymerase sigma factor [Enterococcus dongliensis]|uniref:Sigma-70 family RNA polymerase sigma factor n=1 Tax=Enterococcus dongliensis TaxID=2559925 RepID=A0AAW8TGV3_9ENTE|nr:sigma-70 family RNA polymerase sigma factor [Enterococcus dongliensis]MDT2597609.1 sigma-70 family RNA polymerase sigma factor [Enterococcus dongliensis]MDT2603704.1 sigma-70 family RNA polymerase sigma factor [Enterococcus dongliensis]MDT2634141.1 sigma-70 family RNA polymerase sigma factor [Enterococcus dongliensis]MDT2637071.1 sigma-70 family RNA polymerase sigma factor [Enterococcus dongliensis]MDT2640795.1 sigma-70 family RNA polymerase sigma factor [Enterococcus dongliensis]
MEETTHLETIDGAAFEKMFSQYLPIVYSMQSRYLIRDFDYDDWLQEGRIALNDALQSYRLGRGTTFGLYYKMIFENRIRSLLRRQQAQKRFAQQQAVSIEKVGLEAFSEQFHYHECMEENIYISEMLLAGEVTLSSLENCSLYYYLKGEDPAMIAQRLDESEKAIHNALNRAKNKLKKKLTTIKI